VAEIRKTLKVESDYDDSGRLTHVVTRCEKKGKTTTCLTAVYVQSSTYFTLKRVGSRRVDIPRATMRDSLDKEPAMRFMERGQDYGKHLNDMRVADAIRDKQDREQRELRETTVAVTRPALELGLKIYAFATDDPLLLLGKDTRFQFNSVPVEAEIRRKKSGGLEFVAHFEMAGQKIEYSRRIILP
jgi:hypothetical protein